MRSRSLGPHRRPLGMPASESCAGPASRTSIFRSRRTFTSMRIGIFSSERSCSMHLTMRTLDRPIFGGKRRPSGAFLQRHPPESFNSGSKCIFDMRYDDRVKTMEQNASSLALYLGKRGVLRCEYLSVDVTI